MMASKREQAAKASAKWKELRARELRAANADPDFYAYDSHRREFHA